MAAGFQPAVIRLPPTRFALRRAAPEPGPQPGEGGKADPTHGFLKLLPVGSGFSRIWQHPVFRGADSWCGFKTVAAGFQPAVIRLTTFAKGYGGPPKL